MAHKNHLESYLAQEPKKLMSYHGKSFSFASLILSSKRLEKISYLYRLCRFVDDCADELPPKMSAEVMGEILKDLEEPNRSSLFNKNVQQLELYGVKREYIQQLVYGAHFDVQEEKIESVADFLVYCYRVAGVVGLMMCPLIGVGNKKAYPHAIDLGIAMQITNICRDVKEDAQRGRVYIPHSLIQSIGCTTEEMAQWSETPEEFKAVIKGKLQLAELYYESGYNGLSYIPLRPRFCIFLAGEVYRHIGVKILKNDGEVFKGRVYLNFFEKLMVLGKTIFKVTTRSLWRPKKHIKNLHKEIVHLPGAHA